ncbi:MAG: histidine phosphatase family protein [Anaerolinea sp.]|nr:histidine phosphatase family protein [Anaerolinea sp.]
MFIRTVYLLRHGQEDRDNSPDEWGGDLTTIGIAQAQAAGKQLRHTPLTSIHVSTLRRARHTAKYVAEFHPGVPLLGTNLLWECVPNIPPSLQDMMTHISPEQVERDQARIAHAYDRYFREPENGVDHHDLVVCHGNLIRYFVCRILQAPPEMWVNLEICNCGITRIEVHADGRRVLVSHNDCSHLPPELVTFI